MDETSRRLDPRLRVLRNGGALVNALRANITTTVASTAPAELRSGAMLASSQAPLPIAFTEESEPEERAGAAELQARPKLNEVAQATKRS